jgi:hypothetical protein
MYMNWGEEAWEKDGAGAGAGAGDNPGAVAEFTPCWARPVPENGYV